MKILLQNKNIALANNSLISINSDNIVENGNLVRIKQSSKNNIIKINNSLVRAKVAPDPPVVDTTETWVINETPGSDELDDYNLPKEIFDKKFTVEFISNGKTFNNFRNETHRTGNKFGAWTISYDDTQVYSIGDTWQVWSGNDAYRTITLSAPAAGDFLIWLQKYAVKQ